MEYSPLGPVFIDRDGGSVWRVEGGQLNLLLSGLSSPRRLAKAPDGSILVTDISAHRVWKIPASAAPFVVAGTGNPVAAPGPDADPATSMDLFRPWEVIADATGFWIGEHDGRFVRRVTWTN